MHTTAERKARAMHTSYIRINSIKTHIYGLVICARRDSECLVHETSYLGLRYVKVRRKITRTHRMCMYLELEKSGQKKCVLLDREYEKKRHACAAAVRCLSRVWIFDRVYEHGM